MWLFLRLIFLQLLSQSMERRKGQLNLKQIPTKQSQSELCIQQGNFKDMRLSQSKGTFFYLPMVSLSTCNQTYMDHITGRSPHVSMSADLPRKRDDLALITAVAPAPILDSICLPPVPLVLFTICVHVLNEPKQLFIFHRFSFYYNIFVPLQELRG